MTRSLWHPEEITSYCERHTSPEPSMAQSARLEAQRFDKPHWIIGSSLGTLLRILVRLKRPQEVLEIGCFTGYATAMIIKELDMEARLTAIDIEQAHLDAVRHSLGSALQRLSVRFICDDGFDWLHRSSEGFYDFILIDALKTHISDYYDDITEALTVGGVIVVDNALLMGKVLEPVRPWEVQTDSFNKRLAADNRFRTSLLPIRDGINIALKV